jgi:hypothetical protein
MVALPVGKQLGATGETYPSFIPNAKQATQIKCGYTLGQYITLGNFTRITVQRLSTRRPKTKILRTQRLDPQGHRLRAGKWQDTAACRLPPDQVVALVEKPNCFIRRLVG